MMMMEVVLVVVPMMNMIVKMMMMIFMICFIWQMTMLEHLVVVGVAAAMPWIRHDQQDYHS